MKYLTKFIPRFHIDGVKIIKGVQECVEHIKEGDYINLDLMVFLNELNQGDSVRGTYKVMNYTYNLVDTDYNNPYIEKVYSLALNEEQKDEIRDAVNRLQQIKKELETKG